MSKATDQHTDNIILGSGEVYLDILDSDDNPQGERFLGDAIGATISVASERAQVFSGSGPIARRMVDKIRSISHAIGFTLHDISVDNLALFMAAQDPKSVTQAATAVTDEARTVRRGRWYQLGATAANPAGVAAVSKTGFAVNAAATGNAAIAAAGYVLDDTRGRIYFKPAAADITDDGTDVLIDYTPVAGTREQAKVTDLRPIRAAVRYVEDTDSGEGRNLYAPLCSVGPAGEVALMSRDTEQQLSFTAEVLLPAAGKPTLLIDGAPVT